MQPRLTQVSRFVSEVLDRNGDGKFDASEVTADQLKQLLGNTGTPSSDVTVTQVVNAIKNNATELITNAFKSKDGLTMDFSSYSTHHIAKKLGLTLDECRVTPSVFRSSVENFLNGGKISAPRYVTRHPLTSEASDPYTNSNYKQVSVTHVAASLRFDFDAQQIFGTATYTLGRQDESVLTLDTESIVPTTAGVILRGKPDTLVPTTFRLGNEKQFLGRPLSIDLPPNTQKVVLDYKTGTEADKRAPGLQWLANAQTFSGKKPFFFTQGQYFHNRGLIPLQDTPAAKITTEFKIAVKNDLGIHVVAASDEPHHGTPQVPVRDGEFDVWTYRVTQPIAPYLLTIAAGEIVARKISDRSILYTEPHLIDTAARDYAQYDKLLKSAEAVFGVLPWHKMDTLIMPPSFPYGGMENLGLNMNSNTIITGDKSLMDVAVHEFIHSWFGNLVTNTRIEDFWLNEGLTMYAQRIVIENFFGADVATMDAVLGRGSIENSLSSVGESHNTCLATKAFLENPDDVVSAIPYEKGYLFAVWLEGKFGRKVFLEFLKGYLHDFAFKTLTTEEFVNYIAKKLPMKKAGVTQDQLDTWLYGPGLPDDAPTFVSANMEKVSATVKAWNASAEAEFTIEDSHSWSIHMWTYFMEQLALLPTISQVALDVLHRHYKMSDKNNAEVSRAWFSLVAKNRYAPAYDSLRRFLDGSVGRLKMIRPILVNLKNAGELPLALEIYKTLRPKLHAISQGALDAKLQYNRAAKL